MHPTDEQLLQWKNPSEDHFIERKTRSDAKDWVKTVVAFANSVPYDKNGVLYVGVRNDGSVEQPVNLDELQKTLRRRLDDVYPPVKYLTRVLCEEGQHFLCIVVPGSPDRPHFAGPAYVRVGSETLNASPAQFERLIADRNSKVYKILTCLKKNIQVQTLAGSSEVQTIGRIKSSTAMTVVNCTRFCVVLRDAYGQEHSIALDRVAIIEDLTWPANLTLEVRADER